MSLSTTSKHLLSTFRDGNSIIFVGSLFQPLTTLSEKKYFLISNLNLPWHNLRPFPPVLLLVTWADPHLSTASFQTVVEATAFLATSFFPSK